MLAGIVLYNSDLLRLQENINAIYPQVDKLVLIDNGSKNIAAIEQEYGKRKKIDIVSLKVNVGIAAAQNKICEMARQLHYDWAITLDQDSVVPVNLVEEYMKLMHEPDVGMICPKVIDRNFGEITYGVEHIGVEEVKQCIASASAIRISAWEKVGGFFEPLFIDKVDFDMCWSLCENGYRILRTNEVVLLHEVGHSCVRHFWGKDRLILNHSPLRYYYIIRNSFIVGRRHNRLWRCLRASLRLVYQINVYERSRLLKNKMIFIGFFHGLIGKTGKYAG